MLKTLLLPYLIFQLIYTFYYKQVFSDPIEFELLEPRYAMWFLLSMMLWKLMLTLFGGHKIMIAVSIVLSLFIGYMGEVNEWLSLSRTFFFFPFFLIGYYVDRSTFMKLKNKWNVRLAWISMIFIIFFVYQYGDIRWREWFFGRIPYDEIYYSMFDSAIVSRLVIYVFMIACTFLFLALVPKEQKWYTSIGNKTLTVYLLHLFIIRAFKESTLYLWIDDTGNYLALLLIAFAIVYVLSRNWVWKITAPVLTYSKK